MAESKWIQRFIVIALIILASLSHLCEDTVIFNIKHVRLEVGSVSATLLIIFAGYIIHIWKRHKAIISLRDVIVSLISGGMGFSGIISMVAFLIGVGWLTDDLREGRYWLALNSLGLILSISGLYALSIAVRREIKDKIYPTKVLFSALSIPRQKDSKSWNSLNTMKGLLKKLYCNIKHDDGKSPCIPQDIINEVPLGTLWFSILWRIRASSYQKFRIYLIISEAVEKENVHTRFKECLDLVRQMICSRKVELEVHFSNVVDFNDYHAISREIEYMLNEALRHYDEEEIAFNISPGTSAVTSAMILAALKEARQIEYVTQFSDPVELKAFDITEEEILRFGILQK